jgi:branched-chain amino acid transport system permease protein
MSVLSAIVSGVVLGGIYSLIAIGLSFQYGIARIMNLAYGEFAIGACFVTYLLFSSGGISPLLSLFVVIPLCFALSWLVFRLLLLPLVRRGKGAGTLEVDSILATFGLLFVLHGLYTLTFGGGYTSYSYMSTAIDVLGTPMSAGRVLAAIAAFAIGLGIYLWIERTRLGAAMRAVAVKPDAAPLVGIDLERFLALAFAMGGALVGLAGTLLSMFTTFNASMGVVFTMKALIVVIMGGVGNFAGAILAGLILGLAESLGARFVDSGLTLASNYAIFLFILLVKPRGLFGSLNR